MKIRNVALQAKIPLTRSIVIYLILNTQNETLFFLK